MNEFILVGNMTKDAQETKRTIQTKNGPMTIVDATIAINNRSADGQESTEYFPVTVFGRQAETLCQYGGKGSKIAVTGRMRQDKWEDKETGKTRSRISLSATRVEFCNMKQPSQTQNAQPAAGNYQAQPGNYQAQPNAQGGYAHGNYQPQPGNAPQQGNYAQPGNYQATQNTQPAGNYQPQSGGYAQQGGYQAYQPTENTVGGGQFVAGDDLVDDINF